MSSSKSAFDFINTIFFNVSSSNLFLDGVKINLSTENSLSTVTYVVGAASATRAMSASLCDFDHQYSIGFSEIASRGVVR